MPLSEFIHQSVRDLAWTISTPPLIAQLSHPCIWPQSKWYQQLYQESLPWLNAVDSDPSELDDLLNMQKDRRLGKYFETLWFFWLSHQQRYQIVENNVQIIIDGKTFGEIDFIVFDKNTKKTIHWEVAVKFYLGVGDTREMSNWYGPNLADRLDIKVEHLMHRQSIISSNKQVRHWLKQQGLHIDQCAVILKGRLYYPWHLNQRDVLLDVIAPPQCAPDHLFSWWFKQSQFDVEFDTNQRFIALINKGWLEKMAVSSADEIYHKTSIFKTVSKGKMRLPLHLQLCNPHHSWDRVFLTADNWFQKES